MELATSAGMIGAAILLPLGAATREAVKFEKAMGNVATLVDTAKESMTMMGDSVLEMSHKIAKPIEDLTSALYQIRSDGIAAGNGIDQAFGVLESSGKLAMAGLSSTSEAAKTVTSAMNVFADATLNSQQIANSMFKTVQGGKTTMSELGASFGKNAAIIHSAGVSLYEMNAATAAITATGITASQAQNELGAAVLALMKPTGNLQTLFESIGYEGEGGFKRLITATGGLVPAMEAINNQAKKLGITMSEDFGRKEALVANILLTGERNKAYKDLLAIQKDGNDTLTGKFGEQSETAAAKIQLFHNATERLGISIGNLLIPVLSKIINVVEPIIDGIALFAVSFSGLSELIVGGIAVFGVLAAGLAAVSMATYVATKATWLWTAATTAAKAAAELYQVVLLATSSGMGIMTVAATLLSMTLNTLMGPVGLVIGAIALVGNQMDYTAKKNKFLRNEIKLTKDGFEEIQKPITQATLALRDFMDAKAQHAKDLNNEQAIDYMKKNHPLKYMFSMDNILSNFSGGEYNSVTPEPEVKNYPDLNPSDIPKSDTSEHKVTVVIDNKTGFNTSTKSNSGGIQVNLKQTGSYS
jgi:TP901 family phage tail tape measure protein